MKIDRLIGIILYLLQKDSVTAPELADKFEVSRRTINRDIETICQAGIPLVTLQGYGGGISIAQGYKIDRTLLTREELQAIFTGLKSLDSVSKTSHTEKLQNKLFQNHDIFSVDDAVLIDLASHYQASLTTKIDSIRQAISNQKIITFQYYYSKGESLRKIEPYLLIFKWSSWYVYGFCLIRGDYRLFKLNRLWDLQLTNNHFSLREIPAENKDFDRFFSDEPIHFSGLFDESVKYRLVEEYGVESFETVTDGKLLLNRDFVDYQNMLSWVLGFGDKVVVLKPQCLIEEIRQQAKKVLTFYEEHDR